jgi:hypothetical protein
LQHVVALSAEAHALKSCHLAENLTLFIIIDLYFNNYKYDWVETSREWKPLTAEESDEGHVLGLWRYEECSYRVQEEARITIRQHL